MATTTESRKPRPPRSRLVRTASCTRPCAQELLQRLGRPRAAPAGSPGRTPRSTSCQMPSRIARPSDRRDGAVEHAAPDRRARASTGPSSRASSPAPSSAPARWVSMTGAVMRRPSGHVARAVACLRISTLRSSVMRIERSATSGDSMRRGCGMSIGVLRGDPAGPGREQHDPLGEPAGLAHVVGDEQHGDPDLLPDPQQLVVQQVAGDRVQRRERLVHEQHVAVLRERPGQRHALAHAAGQLVRPLAARAVQADQLEQALRPPRGGRPCRPPAGAAPARCSARR